jgi:hypothetical protein
MLVWTKWTNCPASPAAIVVIQELWWGNGFQGTSLLIPQCCVQNYESLCDSTCRVSTNFISTLAAFSPKSHTHCSCWNTSYLSPIQYLNHGSTKQLQNPRELFCHVYTVHAEHMYLVLTISIRAYGISRLKLGVVWMLLHNYTIKSIAGCRKFRFFGEESECWFHPDTQTSKVYQGAMGGMRAHVHRAGSFSFVLSIHSSLTQKHSQTWKRQIRLI